MTPSSPPQRRMQRVPWESEELFGPKPRDAEFGYLQGRLPRGCTLEELRRKISHGWGKIPLVWTPQSPRYVPAVEAACLFDVVKPRLIRKMILSAIRWSLLGILLAGIVVVGAKEQNIPLPEVRGLALLLLVFWGVLPAVQAIRSAGVLRQFTPQDMFAYGRAARYEAWLHRKTLFATWLVAICILVVAAAQFRIGWDNSIILAGLVKPLPPGQWWRVLSCALMHGNFLHLGVNLFALVILGRWVEVHSRSFYLPFVFVVAAVAGSVASLWYSPLTSVGASGGLMGLIGFLAVMGYRRRSVLPEGFFGLMLANVALICFMGLIERQLIDNAAHVGGALAGAALGLVVFYRAVPIRRRGMIAMTAGIGGALILIATAAWTTQILLASSRRPLPAMVPLQPGDFDATARYAAEYELKGRFHVASGAVKTDPTTGAILCTLRGQFTAPGLYVFQFQRVDESGWAYEVRSVRIQISASYAAAFLIISPEDGIWNRYLEGATFARLGATAEAQWVGHIPNVPGQWELSGVRYEEATLRVVKDDPHR